MDVVKAAEEALDPGQVPIITCDQTLYTLAKANPPSHGEDHFVVMSGGLHIATAVLETLGDLLEGSEWIGTLIQAGVATPETKK